MEMEVSYQIFLWSRQILSNLSKRHHHTPSYLFSEYQKPSTKLPCVYVHDTSYVCCHARLGSHVVKICLKAFSAQLSTKFNADAWAQLEGQPVFFLWTACRTFDEYGPRMASRFGLMYRHKTALVQYLLHLQNTHISKVTKILSSTYSNNFVNRVISTYKHVPTLCSVLWKGAIIK